MTAHAEGCAPVAASMAVLDARLLKSSLGRISHDLSNLLVPLTAYPDLIRMDLPAGAKGHMLLDEIVKTTHIMVRMARHMQDLSICDECHTQELELNDLVAATCGEFRETLPDTLRVEMSLCDDDTRVIGAQDKLGGMLVHLLQNAREATADAGVLQVTTQREFLKVTRHVTTGVVAAGTCLQMIVEDSGLGIDPQHLKSAFEPFFTTKTDEISKRGAGLGLTYCLLVARAHGGLVDIERAPQSGTRVTVYLPCTDENRDLQTCGAGDRPVAASHAPGGRPAEPTCS